MFGATFAATVNPVLITLALTFAAENNTKHTGHAEGAARLYPALGGSYILKRGDFDWKEGHYLGKLATKLQELWQIL